MNLTYLSYFLKVAEKEHVTQVAEELHITQPALSRAMSALEEELGLSLFDRDGKGIRLNENGRVVRDAAQKIFRELDQMQQKLEDMKEGVSGTVLIGSSYPAREPDLIQECLMSFKMEYPNVIINVEERSPKKLIQDLENRTIDLVIASDVDHNKDIEWVEMFRERMGVIISRNSPLMEKESLSLRDLENERFYVNNMNSDVQDLTESYCRRAGFEPNIFFQGHFPRLIGMAVSKGEGVSLMSQTHFYRQDTGKKSDTWQSDIVFRTLDEEYCYRTCGVAINKRAYHSKAVNLFRDYLFHFVYAHPEYR